MKTLEVIVLHPAGPYAVGRQTIPERQAQKLIATGYAAPIGGIVTESAVTPHRPGEKGRRGRRKEQRG